MESQKYISGDGIFEEIFGYKPKKRGEGYEIIVACVLQHLNSNATVSHDERLRTEETKSVYQIDAVVQDLDEKVAVEAKDYKNPIEREVVTKLFGSMAALKIKNAIIATPNGYTKGAVNYPQDVKDQKNIALYIIRKAKDDDYTLPSGSIFLKAIQANLCVQRLVYDQGKFETIPDAKDIEDILRKTGKTSISHSCRIYRFYKSDSSEVPVSIMSDEINKKHAGLTEDEYIEDEYIEGEWIPSEDLYVKVEVENHELVKIDKIKYKVPIHREKIEWKVKPTSPILFVKTGTEDKDENYRMVDKKAILSAYRTCL